MLPSLRTTYYKELCIIQSYYIHLIIFSCWCTLSKCVNFRSWISIKLGALDPSGLRFDRLDNLHRPSDFFLSAAIFMIGSETDRSTFWLQQKIYTFILIFLMDISILFESWLLQYWKLLFLYFYYFTTQ